MRNAYKSYVTVDRCIQEWTSCCGTAVAHSALVLLLMWLAALEFFTGFTPVQRRALRVVGQLSLEIDDHGLHNYYQQRSYQYATCDWLEAGQAVPDSERSTGKMSRHSSAQYGDNEGTVSHDISQTETKREPLNGIRERICSGGAEE